MNNANLIIKTFLLSFSLILIIPVQAQERLGMQLGNYAGLTSISLNPAHNVVSPLRWEVQLMGNHTFMDNDYFFFQDANIFKITDEDVNFLSWWDFERGARPNSNTIITNAYNDKDNMHFYINQEIQGPGFMFNFYENFSAGIFTKARFGSSVRNISNDMAYFRVAELSDDGDTIRVRPFQMAFMAWNEIGLNLAYKADVGSNALSVGINIKRLSAYETFYFDNRSNYDVILQPGTQVDLTSIDAEIGLTTNNIRRGINEEDPQLDVTGRGWGIDIGMEYYIEPDYYGEYKYKIGFSLMDVGGIQIDNGAEVLRLNQGTLVQIDEDNYSGIEDYDATLQQLEQDLYGGSGTSVISRERFFMGLPTAMSLQFEYNHDYTYFLNATLVQRINFGANAISRSNLLAVTPRYESRWFDLMLPISMYEYKYFHVGFAARLGFLTVGTENFTSLFGSQDEFTGTDFYFALKLSPFKTRDKSTIERPGIGCFDF